METQNITLSLPKELLIKVKLLAVERQTSVSNLLIHTLDNLVRQEKAYLHSQRRHMQWLKPAADFGRINRQLSVEIRTPRPHL